MAREEGQSQKKKKEKAKQFPNYKWLHFEGVHYGLSSTKYRAMLGNRKKRIKDLVLESAICAHTGMKYN